VLGCRGGAELLGIEAPADPFEHARVVFVLRIADGLEEISVSPRSAAVFRRAGASALDTTRITRVRFRWHSAFKDDFVPPAVAEVVFVEKAESTALLRQELAQTNFGGIEEVVLSPTIVEEFRVTIAMAANLELVEMELVQTIAV
jgi:hypothetical protein